MSINVMNISMFLLVMHVRLRESFIDGIENCWLIHVIPNVNSRVTPNKIRIIGMEFSLVDLSKKLCGVWIGEVEPSRLARPTVSFVDFSFRCPNKETSL